MKPTRTEQLIARLQNHRWVAILVLVGTVVIGLSTFTDATKNLLGLFGKQTPEEARLKLSGLSIPYTPESFLSAAEAGDLTLVNLFVAAGMDPSLAAYATEGGPTPLMYAAQGNHPEVVEALLHAGAKVSGPNNYALSGAVRSGNVAILERLLKSPVTTADLNEAFTAGGGRAMLEVLLAHGADIRVSGAEALLNSRDPEATAFLLAHGADINARDTTGHTLMERLSYDGMNLDTLQTLIARGASMNSTNKAGETPLRNFASRDFVRGVELVLATGVPVDAADANGRTALSLACEEKGGHAAEIASLLLGHGAKVNVTDQAGHTPLFYAHKAANPEVVHVLQEHGAE